MLCFRRSFYNYLERMRWKIKREIHTQLLQCMHSFCTHFHTVVVKEMEASRANCKWNGCVCVWMWRKCFAGCLIDGGICTYPRFDLTAYIVVIQFNWILYFIFFHHIFITFLFIHAAAILHTSNYLQNKMCDAPIFQICMNARIRWCVWVFMWTSVLNNTETIQLNPSELVVCI